jgi:hypothetical protein
METYISLQKLVTEASNRIDSWQMDLFKSAGNLNEMLIEKLDAPRDIIRMHDKSFCGVALAKPSFDTQDNGNLSIILLTEANFKEFIKFNVLNFSIIFCFPTSELNNSVSTFKLILGVRFCEGNVQYSMYDHEFQQQGDWVIIDEMFSKIIEALLSDINNDPYHSYKKSSFGFQ